MAQIIIIYSLKAGVKPADFETWVRDVDYPAMRGLSRVQSFNTHRSDRHLMGDGVPSAQYVEVFEISDLDGFLTEDMPSETVQSVMGQFMGFADNPEFIISNRV